MGCRQNQPTWNVQICSFVDLKLGKEELPDFFIVPSKDIFNAFDTRFLSRTNSDAGAGTLE